MTVRRVLLVLGLSLVGLGAVLALLRPWEGVDCDPAGGGRDGAPGTNALLRADAAREGARGPVLRGNVVPPSPEAPIRADEGVVTGCVLHAETGEPVPGVPVHALSWSDPEDQEILASCVSGAEGGYLLRGLRGDAGRVVVIAMGGGWGNAEVARGPAPRDAGRTWEVEIRAGQAVPFHVHVLPAGRLEGTVRDAAGAPVADAIVCIPYVGGREGAAWTQPAFPWQAVPSAHTDVAGRFVIDGLPWGDGVLCEARREGGSSADSPCVSVRPGETTTVAIVFPETRSAAIRVLDARTGQPIPGAAAALMPRGGRSCGPGHQEGRTGEDGTVILAPLVADPAILRVDAVGYYPWCSFWDETAREDAWVLFEVGADGRFEAAIVLEPASTLSGRVVLPEGIPWERVRVWMEASKERYAISTLVDAEGCFRLTVPPGERWVLHVRDQLDEWELETHAEARSGDADIVLRPERVPSEARLHDGPAWDLLLIGPDGEVPASARLGIRWKGVGDYPLVEFEGGYVFPEVVPDDTACSPSGLRCRLSVSPRYGPVWVTVFVDDADLAEITRGPFGVEGGTATIEIPRARTIEVRVVDPDGNPVQGVEVDVWALRPEGMPTDWSWWGLRASGLSDAEGRFVVGNMEEGAFRLSVDHAAGWVYPAPVMARAGARDVVVRLLGGIEATVVVHDEEGVPVAGATVCVRQRDGVRGPDAPYRAVCVEVRTDDEGRALLHPLEQGGTFDLRVKPPEDSQKEMAGLRIERWTPMDDVLVLPTFRRVSGVVRDPAGQPVEGVRVMLRENEPIAWHRTNTDAAGCFVFPRVSPGAVRVGACLPSLVPPGRMDVLMRDVEAGADDLVFVVDPGRALRLGVSGVRDGKERVSRLEVTPLDVSPRTEPTHHIEVPYEGDEVRVRGLRDGVRYRVWGGPTAKGRFVEAIVEPGDDVVILALRQGGTIRGTVALPEGTERARVWIADRGLTIHVPLEEGNDGFALTGVPDGTWRVVASCIVDGEFRCVEKEAKAGDEVTFDLTEIDR